MCVPVSQCCRPPLHRRDGAQLRGHPQPGGRVHSDPTYLRFPASLLHEDCRRHHRGQGLHREVREIQNQLNITEKACLQ